MAKYENLLMYSPYIYCISRNFTIVKQPWTNGVQPSWSVGNIQYSNVSMEPITMNIDSSTGQISFSSQGPSITGIISFDITVTDILGRSLTKKTYITVRDNTNTYMLGSTSYSTTNDLTGRLVFTSNTTLKFFFDTYIRTFAIGGGGGGGSEGSPSSNAWSWAGGGYSGEISCATDIFVPKNTPISIIVGAGGITSSTSSRYQGGTSSVSINGVMNMSTVAYGGFSGYRAFQSLYSEPFLYGWNAPGLQGAPGATAGGTSGSTLQNNWKYNTGIGRKKNLDIETIKQIMNTPIQSCASHKLLPEGSYTGMGYGAGGYGNSYWYTDSRGTVYAGGGNGGHGISLPGFSLDQYGQNRIQNGSIGFQGIVLIEWN